MGKQIPNIFSLLSKGCVIESFMKVFIYLLLKKHVSTFMTILLQKEKARGFFKSDLKLQLEKLLMATKFHDKIGMLDTHLNEEVVDMLVKNNKELFQEFPDPILIPSQTWWMSATKEIIPL